MQLLESIINLKKIGKERKKLLNNLKIYTIYDLLTYFPKSYEDIGNIKKIYECKEEEKVNIKARIYGDFNIKKLNSISILKVKVKDNTGIIEILWFNKNYLKNYLKNDTYYIFTGKIKKVNNKFIMYTPNYENINKEENLILPVYSLTKNLTQKMLRIYIKEALDKYKFLIKDIFKKDFKDKYNICDKLYAIENIHFPKYKNDFLIARKRLVFEELFLMQLSLFLIKGTKKIEKSNLIIKDTCLKDIIKLLDFELTKSQKDVIKEIIEEIKKGNLVYRLIQGDVGSGKTIIAIILSYIIIKNNYQSAIMAPTDILAKQHYISFKKILDKLNIKTVFLSSSLKKKEKEEIKEKIKTGKAKMIVGTHAIIEESVEFLNLGMAITDEQHRFGVNQRLKLSKKGENPNIIIMSATPIPRTLALILYGDLDISILKEKPKGRQKIETYYVTSKYRQRFYNFIKKEIDKGHQIYIVCPIVEKSEKIDLYSIIEYTENIKEKIFKNYKVKYIYGKMKKEEKENIMDNFIKGNIDIIVATTVIEVGINVSNATIILIENAERYGISQLHQLRGRVGRGDKKSYCILVTDSKNKITKERMKALVSTDDGFKLSELDLKLRGHGDFFGTKQHGIPEFKIANLYEDTEILKLAQKAAKDIYNSFDNNSIILKNIAKNNFIDNIQI